MRAEIDAFFAKKYGLTRDELRYVLDPQDIKGEDYPSETFRGLKNKEIQQYGEYRTQRLVLEAFDKMTATKMSAVVRTILAKHAEDNGYSIDKGDSAGWAIFEAHATRSRLALIHMKMEVFHWEPLMQG